ncbi:uncharacterized protein LOC126259994, partial [Schistocerca nitens]|uniref:uncharacterized protein LOC126259994 n=1 Tax=Schistocerca nitens TaxID=7011 RepID=UPI0021176843
MEGHDYDRRQVTTAAKDESFADSSPSLKSLQGLVRLTTDDDLPPGCLADVPLAAGNASRRPASHGPQVGAGSVESGRAAVAAAAPQRRPRPTYRAQLMRAWEAAAFYLGVRGTECNTPVLCTSDRRATRAPHSSGSRSQQEARSPAGSARGVGPRRGAPRVLAGSGAAPAAASAGDTSGSSSSSRLACPKRSRVARLAPRRGGALSGAADITSVAAVTKSLVIHRRTDAAAAATPANRLTKPPASAAWPAPMPDMPKIISLDVKCERDLMKVYLAFDKPFYGIVFSKGHYSNVNCVHLPAGLGRKAATFDISIHSCGTAGNSENGLYGYGADSGSGTYFENIIVVQYDPQVQEVWDQARKLRCTWHDQYEKSVTFRPFPVDMLDVVRADFAGDNVGCWMQIQVGKGPWASEVSGLVKIGQTMTMVLAIKDDDSKFDMLVRNCMAHDGKRAPIQLVDQKGCVTRPKLMSRFTKIKNFGASASVLSYAHFQAFKFPDSMEVHFQCTIQICRNQCPDQCSEAPPLALYGADTIYGKPSPPPQPLEAYLNAAGAARPRDERRVRRQRREVPPHDARRQQDASGSTPPPEKSVGVNRVIRVVSTGDLTFPLDEAAARQQAIPVAEGSTAGAGAGPDSEPAPHHLICMTTPGFAATLVVLLAVLLASCLASALLCVRLRPLLAAA